MPPSTFLVLLGGALFFVFIGQTSIAGVYLLGCFVTNMDDGPKIVWMVALFAAHLFQRFIKAGGGAR